MRRPAFQFYADDFLSGTIHLTDAEVGLYIRLLCVQWNCGSLPNDKDELLSYGRNNDGSAIGKVMAKFQLCDDGRLRNQRMEEVRTQQMRFMAERSKSGSKGAESRWLSHGSAINHHGSAIKQPMAKNGTPTPTPTPTPNKKEGEGAGAPTPTTESHVQNFPEAEIPSWNEWWGHCKSIGLIAEWYAKDKFLAAEQEFWRFKSNWRAYATRCFTWWVQDGRPSVPPPKRTGVVKSKNRGPNI